MIAALAGVESREAAEALKGVALFAADAGLPPATEGEYYTGDLVGLAVRGAGGTEIGRVAGVYNFGAGDVVEIAFTEGSVEMYPFQAAFFPEVRVGEGWLRLERPEEV